AQDLLRGLEIGIARGDEGDQRGAALALQGSEATVYALRHQIFIPRRSATANTSLSPRPHMFMTSRSSLGSVGASLRTKASAWAGSSAGMMPSRSVQSWNASSASLSVMAT